MVRLEIGGILRKIPKIQRSKDYGQFVLINKELAKSKKEDLAGWNRKVRPGPLAKMMKSFDAIGNMSHFEQILVWPKDKSFADKEYPDGKYPIVSGQTRFVSIKHNKDWVYFIIDEDKELRPEDVHWLNTATPWSLDDTMNYWCAFGIKEYAIYAGFKKRSGWSHNNVIGLLVGNTKGAVASFKQGALQINRSIAEANDIIKKINDFSRFFRHYKSRSFVTAMLRMIENVPEYDHKRMMQKMEYLSERLVKCPDAESYTRLLEKLYNFKSTGKFIRFI